MDRNQNVRISAGDDRVVSIAVANPAAADLTGAQARYIVSRSPYDPRPPLISKTTGAGITIETGAGVPPGYAAVLKVAIGNDDTAELEAGWYYHEAIMTLQSGVNIAVMNGQFRLDPSYIASQL